jgi:mono/diheme cytochrome c family protein
MDMRWMAATTLVIAYAAAAVEGPFRLPPGEESMDGHGTGSHIDDFDFTDHTGQTHRFRKWAAGATVVIAVRDAECPVSRKYGPRLAEFEREFGARGVRFLFLDLSARDTPALRAADRARFDFRGPYVADAKGRVGRLLGARSSGDAFVVDGEGRLRYRGAVDDQFGIGYTRDRAMRPYLRAALEAVLAGREVAVPATTAPACLLSLAPPNNTKSDAGPTFHREVSRIVHRRCAICHRPGEVGPFPLLTYDDVASRREMIRFVIENRIMPPWPAADGTGPWANSLALEDAERATLLRWIADGAPAGDPADALPPPVWPQDAWRIGKPDVVLTTDEPVRISPELGVVYRHVFLDTDFDSDRWVQAMEIRTDTPRNTHHVLVFLIPPRAFDDDTSDTIPWRAALRGYLALYVAGTAAYRYPDGMAKRIPRGARLLLQLHYEPNGEPVVDRPRSGIKFAREPPRHELTTLAASTTDIEIPPGAGNHRVAAEHRLRQAGTLVGFGPHTHLAARPSATSSNFPTGAARPCSTSRATTRTGSSTISSKRR